MSNLGKLIGLEFDHDKAVDFSELEESKPERPLVGPTDKQAIRETLYELGSAAIVLGIDNDEIAA